MMIYNNLLFFVILLVEALNFAIQNFYLEHGIQEWTK